MRISWRVEIELKGGKKENNSPTILAAVLIVVGGKLAVDVSAQRKANVAATYMTPAFESGCAVAGHAFSKPRRYSTSKSLPNCSPPPQGD